MGVFGTLPNIIVGQSIFGGKFLKFIPIKTSQSFISTKPNKTLTVLKSPIYQRTRQSIVHGIASEVRGLGKAILSKQEAYQING
jgi:hypothetical protein